MMGKQAMPVGSSSESVNVQEGKVSETRGHSEYPQEKEVLPPQAFMQFKVGEFAGKVSESNATFFHAHLKPVVSYEAGWQPRQLKEIPAIHQDANVSENFHRIQREAESVLN